jgi:hypothetical protein
VRHRTIPAYGRDFDSRFSRTADSAKSVSLWLVFPVSSVNHVLSVSEMVRPSRWRYTSPTTKSS